MKRNFEVTFQTLLSALLCVGVVMLSGCTLAHAIKGEKQTDINIRPIKPGMTKYEAEAILGSPSDEWQVPSGVTYRVYTYYAGSRYDTRYVLGVAVMDISSLGLFEAMVMPRQNADMIQGLEQRFKLTRRDQVAISYDSNEVILGVFRDFSEFDALPGDGLPSTRALKQSP